MRRKLKTYLIKVFNISSWMVIVAALLLVLYAFTRIFICDQFVIPTNSMDPTLIPGDRILVNKMIFGARIYKNYDFTQGQPLKSWRMPGLRRIKPNDILVFNYPRGYDRAEIEFKINYVFSKRCIGTPGDTIVIKNGIYGNNKTEGIIGLKSMQQRLSITPDSLIPGHVFYTLPFDGRWTIKEFGPLYVPAKGDTIHLEPGVYDLYKVLIEYETGIDLRIEDDRILLGRSPLTHYIFQTNYFFVGGDNVLDSGDSRYWGFVPEEFIIGVAKRISYSRDRYNGKFRWDRFCKRINKINQRTAYE